MRQEQSGQEWPSALSNWQTHRPMWRLLAKMAMPPRRRSASEWADESRVLPPGSAEPGPFRSSRTPYCIPIAEAYESPHYRRIVAVMGSQMGKTAGLLNVIGKKLDDDPAPVLYIGPTKSNVDGVIEPQVQQMLRSCESLWAKTLQGRKAQKLIKKVAGVTLRLAWAGSATELASQPAHTVMADEVDRMEPIPGEGDPVTLAEARIATYPDGRLIVTSTPTEGAVDVERDPVSGIEHWTVGAPEDISSQSWRLWQEGTRYAWCVPCPHCHEYFMPRFQLLTWPEGCSPRRALREARLACSQCGSLIGEEHKSTMNARGLYVAPGQKVENGKVLGEPPESDTISFWASGLMSPWLSFGQRAASWLYAVASGDQGRIRGVLNTAFGELYRTKGQAPEWQAVKECTQDYELGDVPSGAALIFCTVDVQKDRLVCTVRGWGPEFESWLIHREELWGDTDQPEVWARLDGFVDRQHGGRPIQAVAVDSGYRTDKVYEWCHRHSGRAYATKGRDAPSKLYGSSAVEVNRGGKRLRTGLKLWTLDAGYFKAWVHDRVGWPQDQPGAWHLPRDIDEDYCKQIVAEQRMRLPSGRAQWVRTSKDNHYLDCEAMQVFLAHVEGVRSLKAQATVKPPKRRSTYLSRNSGYLRS